MQDEQDDDRDREYLSFPSCWGMKSGTRFPTHIEKSYREERNTPSKCVLCDSIPIRSQAVPKLDPIDKEQEPRRPQGDATHLSQAMQIFFSLSARFTAVFIGDTV